MVGVYLEKMAVAAELILTVLVAAQAVLVAAEAVRDERAWQGSGVKVLMDNISEGEDSITKVGCLDELTVRPLQDLQHHCWTSLMITIDRFPFLLISWCSDQIGRWFRCGLFTGRSSL